MTWRSSFTLFIQACSSSLAAARKSFQIFLHTSVMLLASLPVVALPQMKIFPFSLPNSRVSSSRSSHMRSGTNCVAAPFGATFEKHGRTMTTPSASHCFSSSQYIKSFFMVSATEVKNRSAECRLTCGFDSCTSLDKGAPVPAQTMMTGTLGSMGRCKLMLMVRVK